MLLYCHDGSGHGHASRTVAIGLALRRIAPDARVLLATGSAAIEELAGGANLDWVKLPSYRYGIRDGTPMSLRANSGYDAADLAPIRAALLRELVLTLRPRVLFVDHMPGGKKNELLPALAEMGIQRGKCILGVRAIMGDVPLFWSDFSRDVMARHYSGCLWFGDARLPDHELARIREHLGCTPIAAGLVCRALELERRDLIPDSDAFGTIAFSWCDPATPAAAAAIASAIGFRGDPGPWNVYVGPVRGDFDRGTILSPFAGESMFRIEPFRHSYLGALRASRLAVAYGGYNTLTDLLWARTAAIVLTRTTTDAEQTTRADRMKNVFGNAVAWLRDTPTADAVSAALDRQSTQRRPAPPDIDIDGAARAAEHLLSL